MEHNPPEWINELAAEIHSLIRKYDYANRFRKMVETHIKKDIKQSKENFDWDDRRSRYFEEEVKTNERLQDKEAGPPDEKWIWEYGEISTEGNQNQLRMIEGWVPAELSINNEPKVKIILPLDPKVDYTIEDKYTCLAAVYYRAKKGVEDYDIFPKADEENGGTSQESIIAKWLKRQDVSPVKDDDRVWLENMLKDVREDLKKRYLSKQNEEYLSKPTPTLIKEARWYAKKGNRKYIIIAITAIPLVAFLGSFGSDIYSKITVKNKRGNHIILTR